jgi:hypothetical protein
MGTHIENAADRPNTHPKLFGNRPDAGSLSPQFYYPLPIEKFLWPPIGRFFPDLLKTVLPTLFGFVVLLASCW